MSMTYEELQTSYDWREVFGQGSGGNCDRNVDSPDGTPAVQVDIADVKRVLLTIEGENDESDWAGLFMMNDGRYLAAFAGCDYTGWDCRASNTLTVASSVGVAVAMGFTDEHRRRLSQAAASELRPVGFSLLENADEMRVAADHWTEAGDADIADLLRNLAEATP